MRESRVERFFFLRRLRERRLKRIPRAQLAGSREKAPPSRLKFSRRFVSAPPFPLSLPSDVLRCWLNQGAAPGCAPYLSRCLLGEKLRSSSTANIAECGHCRGTYIGTGKREKSSEASGSRDGWIFISFLFSLFFVSSSSYFSHIIVRSGCEKQQHRSICFPERSDPRKQCYTWHCVLFIRYYYIVF